MLIQQAPSTSPTWNDLWATILFIIHLAGFVVIAYYALRGAHIGDSAWLTPQEQEDLSITLLIVAAFATGVGILYTLLMHSFAQPLIYISMFLCCVVYIFFAIYSFITIAIWAGILWLLLGLFQIFFFFAVRARIPFAALMLSTIVSIMWKFPSVFLVTIVTTLIQIGWSVLFIFVGTYATGVWTGGALYGIFIYIVFSYYWTSQVIKNVQHVTASGLFATYYFFSGAQTFPRNPVAGSFSRAMTYSFGSICFGSLLVALIQITRYVLRSLVRNQWLRCFIDCILGCIENIFKWVSFYAYAEVAIYGKSFCQAGKDTLEMLSRSGLDVIVNDNLIGSVIMICIMFVSWASFGIGYGIFYALASGSGIYLLVAFAALFVG